MDQESIEQTITLLNQQPFVWLSMAIGTIISALLASIVYLLKTGKEESKDAITDFRSAWNKHDDILREQQKEIASVRQDTKVAIELIKVQQEAYFNGERKRGKR